MRTMMKIFGCAAVALLMGAGAASASWTGCGLGVNAGAAAMDTKAGLSATGIPGSIIELDGISASGGGYGASANCDLKIDNRFVVGAFIDYTKFQNADWNLNILSGIPGGGINFTTGLDQKWSLGVRGGYLLSESTLAYVLAAYSELKMDAFSGSFGGTPIGSLSMPTFRGYELGAGIETKIRPDANWYLKAEYRYFQADGKSVEIGGAGSGVFLDVDPNVHTAMVGLSYKFGPTEAARPLK